MSVILSESWCQSYRRQCCRRTECRRRVRVDETIGGSRRIAADQGIGRWQAVHLGGNGHHDR